jgi:hypothetical protein
MTIRPAGRALAALAVLGLAGCAKESSTFPPGVEPWDDPAAAPQEWPALPEGFGTVARVAGTRIASGSDPSYHWAHGRVRLDATLDQVWAALQWRPGVLVAVAPDTEVDCAPENGVEAGYAVSFSVKEIPNSHGEIGRANWFLVDWRADATRGAGQALEKVNVKAQKVEGTAYIVLMRQSVVATPAPGGGVALDVVRHINAPDESETSAGDWISKWVRALEAQIAGDLESISATSRCFP